MEVLLLVVWGSIAASQIKLRPQLEKEGPLTVKMWLYPYLSWAAIIMLIALTVLMLTDPTARMQVLGTLAVVVILTLLGLINKAWRKKHPVTGSTVVKTEETTD